MEEGGGDTHRPSTHTDTNFYMTTLHTTGCGGREDGDIGVLKLVL